MLESHGSWHTALDLDLPDAKSRVWIAAKESIGVERD